MIKTKLIHLLLFLLVGLSVFDPPGSVAEMRKRNLSVGEARRELGVVAAYQNFSEKYRIDRFETLEAGGEFYHIFLSYVPRGRLWRTLVFSNSGDYLGYFQTVDPPVETEKDALVFPGPSYSSENGDFAEGEFDSGDAFIIRFNAVGPPDEVKFEHRTFTFVSSPRRIRPDDPAYRFSLLANRVADAMNRSRFKSVREDFSPEALHRISERQTVEILSDLRTRFGKVLRVGDPWVQSAHTAVLPITFERTVAGLKLTLSKKNEIVGMWVLPFKTAFPDLGKSETELRLPFSDWWRVMWGGDNRDQSKYFGSRVSHNALEFVISSRFNKTFKNDGKYNQDYFAYGKPVLAPAAGTVVAVIEGVEDNKPHSPNPFDRLGNAIMIEHTTNEYSVIGHLKNESISVRVGERVVAGLPIALCGNSGDSSQPSIYFHLQDSAQLLAGSGYKPLFSNLYYRKEGKTAVLPEYSPVRGEFIQQRSVPKKAGATR